MGDVRTRSPRVSVGSFAEVTTADGSTIIWQPPQDRVWPTGLRAERWRKWWGKVRRDSERDPMARSGAGPSLHVFAPQAMTRYRSP